MNEIPADIIKWLGLVKDVGLTIGLAGLLTVAWRVYNMWKDVMKERHELVRERDELRRELTWDRALEIIKSQSEDFEIERVYLEKRIEQLEGSLSVRDEEKQGLRARLQEVDATIEALDRSREVIEHRRTSYSYADICGAYEVEGSRPGGPLLKPYASLPGKYRGRLSIEKTGTTLQLKWTIGKRTPYDTYEGKGFIVGDMLPAVIQETTEGKEDWWGVVAYRIVGPGELRGVWTGLHDEVVGNETCRRISGTEAT